MVNRIFIKLAMCALAAAFALLSLVSCAATGDYINPEFKVYVNDFEKNYKVKVKCGMIFSTTLGNKTAGRCTLGTIPWIEINKKYWDRYRRLERASLILHELTHCVLQRHDIPSHSDGMFLDGCFNSTMNKDMDSEYCFSKHWEELMDRHLKEYGPGGIKRKPGL